ncbi:MAG: glutathione S-transferase family protein [Ketobacteraceae bacterium]|nr:glutathione S-transferase family protein [Ketobacteraceae bacterium]
MTISIYGAALSPFVRKVRVIAREKQLDYEHIHIDPFRKPDDYRELSPFGRIPALKDGDKVLADSGVIACYLESQYPEPALYPTDPYLKAKALWFEKFGDYELAPVATFGVFRNRVVMRLMGNACDEDLVAECLENKLPPLLDYLEKELGDSEYIVDNQFSVADISIATHFVNLSLGGEKIVSDKWPKSAAYVDRILSRPSFAELSEKEHGFVKKHLG